MGRAEVGSTKYISNKLKSKGLQRLRWYCQVCERQMRDENGFKCHTQSESHVRQMLLVGEDPKKYINQYSQEFLSDFIKLLRTAHGEKPVHINHFYQEYIANKEHIHMNATKWTSLTEFAKYLGKESLCRVEEGEKGLFIAWIDNSPEALRRQDAIRKKERQDRGDEEREKKMIEEQIRRAQLDSAAKKKQEEDAEKAEDESRKMLQRAEGEKVKLSFAPKTTTTTTTATTTTSAAASPSTATTESSNTPETAPSAEAGAGANQAASKPPTTASTTKSTTTTAPAPASTGFKMSNASTKPKNVFAAAAAKKKNALGDNKKSTSSSSTSNAASRPLSATERIIKEDMERKRRREGGAGVGFYSTKKSRVA